MGPPSRDFRSPWPLVSPPPVSPALTPGPVAGSWLGGVGLLPGLRAGFWPLLAPPSNPSSSLARHEAGYKAGRTVGPVHGPQDCARFTGAGQLAAGIEKNIYLSLNKTKKAG